MYSPARAAPNDQCQTMRTGGAPHNGHSSECNDGHGSRASFRTISDEVLKFRVDLFKHQIAHELKDLTWSDHLDRIKSGANEKIIEIQKRA